MTHILRPGTLWARFERKKQTNKQKTKTKTKKKKNLY